MCTSQSVVSEELDYNLVALVCEANAILRMCSAMRTPSERFNVASCRMHRAGSTRKPPWRHVSKAF